VIAQTVGEICCRKCGRALAYSEDGYVLRVGEVELFTRAAMACVRCGYITVWREAPIDEYDRSDLTPEQWAVSDRTRQRLGKR
jgi:hypothetical protein